MFLNPYCHLVIATNKEKVSLSVLHPSLKFLSLSESLTWQSLKLEEIISKSSASPPTREKKNKTCWWVNFSVNKKRKTGRKFVPPLTLFQNKCTSSV